MNGFVDSDPNEVVSLHPADPWPVRQSAGLHRGPDPVDPAIDLFGGVVGRANWPIGAFAVATNSQNLTFPFGMLG